MDEVQPDASDDGAVVMEAVEQALLGAPVESLLPVGDQLAEIGRVHSAVPALCILVWEASAPETGREIVEDWLGTEISNDSTMAQGGGTHGMR